MEILSQNQTRDVTGHPEVIIPQELLGHAVEKGSDAQELEIEKDVINTELPQAVEATTTITTSTGSIHLPLTYQQALEKKNSTHFWDSMHWLAASVMYQWMKYDPDIVRAVKKK